MQSIIFQTVILFIPFPRLLHYHYCILFAKLIIIILPITGQSIDVVLVGVALVAHHVSTNKSRKNVQSFVVILLLLLLFFVFLFLFLFLFLFFCCCCCCFKKSQLDAVYHRVLLPWIQSSLYYKIPKLFTIRINELLAPTVLRNISGGFLPCLRSSFVCLFVFWDDFFVTSKRLVILR